MQELNYDADHFEDILAKDGRYAARAYTLLCDVLTYLSKEHQHFSAADILSEFKERALDLFGPMTYTVLVEWGLNRTEDIGEMMFNLVETARIGKDENDSPEDFAGGYDFIEAFKSPYGF